jgi:hypothetical protein
MPLRWMHMVYGAGCQHGQVAEYCMWLLYVMNIKYIFILKLTLRTCRPCKKYRTVVLI